MADHFGPKPEGAEFDRLADEQGRYADIAASIQLVTEEAMVRLAREAHRLVGGDTLCIGGGVGLNSVVNWKIVEQTPFKHVSSSPRPETQAGRWALRSPYGIRCEASARIPHGTCLLRSRIYRCPDQSVP